MARKAYSGQEREQVREALLTTALQCIMDRGLIHSSIEVLCGKVGISKSFFYTFFSSKEELVLEALRYQQPKLLQYARQLMEDPALSWREGVRTFLETCAYGEKKGIAVLSIEEEQEIYRCLSQESFQTFREDQTKLFRELLMIFGLPAGSVEPRLFGNLALSMMMTYKAIPNTMPFLFPEVAEDMVEFQITALLNELLRIKEKNRQGERGCTALSRPPPRGSPENQIMQPMERAGPLPPLLVSRGFLCPASACLCVSAARGIFHPSERGVPTYEPEALNI